MDDTKSLLMMVLHKIFQHQPKIIENTFQLIHNFNNGKMDKKYYEKTLKSICDLMNDQLPSPILVYVLTLVDMPEDYDSQSQIVKKMKKTLDHLPEMNVRPHLVDFLNKNCAKNENIKKSVVEKFEPTPKPRMLRRTRKLIIRDPLKPLLDICANYVVKNEEKLKKMYKRKQLQAWRMINSNRHKGQELEQCYEVVKDLNKKNRILREIDSENISLDFLTEEWKNCSHMLLAKNRDELALIESDPFVMSPECDQAINELFNYQE